MTMVMLITNSNSSGNSNTEVQGATKVVPAEQWQQTGKMATTTVVNKKIQSNNQGSNDNAMTASSNSNFVCSTMAQWGVVTARAVAAPLAGCSDCNSKIKNELQIGNNQPMMMVRGTKPSNSSGIKKLWCSQHQSGSSKSSGGYVGTNIATAMVN